MNFRSLSFYLLSDLTESSKQTISLFLNYSSSFSIFNQPWQIKSLTLSLSIYLSTVRIKFHLVNRSCVYCLQIIKRTIEWKFECFFVDRHIIFDTNWLVQRISFSLLISQYCSPKMFIMICISIKSISWIPHGLFQYGFRKVGRIIHFFIQK